MDKIIRERASFDLIREEIDNGLSGKNRGISMGFKRLNKYISIRKRIMTLVMGGSGSGKTSFTTEAYILNPFEHYCTHPETNMKVIFFSMERSKVYTITKWLTRKIYLSEGVLIPIGKMLGWWEDNKLSHDEHDLILKYEDYINKLTEEFVEIIEGTQNPFGIHKYLKEFSEKRGKIEHINEFKKVYIPDKNEVIIPIIDHISLIKQEKGQSTKKEAVDKLCEYMQIARDLLGYSPTLVSQLNRSLSAGMYGKAEEIEPNLDSAKESGAPSEAADVVLSLFEPLRYRTSDPSYNAEKFVDPNTGGRYFRSLKILKSTYSEADIRMGLAFQGATGVFKELRKPKDIQDIDYEEILNGSYFLK